MKPPLTFLVAATLLLGVGLAFLPAHSGFAQDQADSGQPPRRAADNAPDLDTIRTDMEVMRRVVNKRVLGVRSTGNTNVHSLTAFFATNGAPATGSELFYVKGGGVTLRIDVPFTVVPPEPAKDENGAPKQAPSLWDDVLADVEGRPNKSSGKVMAKLFDPERLKTFEELLLETLGLYGGRMRGIQDHESLTVIVKGRTSARIISSRKLESGVYEYRIRDGEREITKTSASPLSRLIGNAGTSILTYRVSFADLRSAAAERITKEQLRQRTTVHRY